VSLALDWPEGEGRNDFLRFAINSRMTTPEGPDPSWPPVIIHHTFVIVDTETDSPTTSTGSANMSGNSVFYNDRAEPGRYEP
jgi:hypothetical protein